MVFFLSLVLAFVWRALYPLAFMLTKNNDDDDEIHATVYVAM